ncbi:MAG: hypothetical protein QOF78_3252 [Phycisphaerales bacterium]|jgi:hypothetical protein|nr:hypothetical protein [Phycisphaerales bacterium]
MTNTFDLVADAQNKLTLKRAGADDVHDVRIRRAFPWSNAQQFVSIRNSEGKELILIDDVAALAPRVREAIDQYLAATVLIPRIESIVAIDVRFGFQEWRVNTDRGPAAFRVQEREDIRFLPDGRYSIKDADGNIYELPPRKELDDHSRKALGPLI